MLRGHAAGDTEGDSQRQGDDADDDAGDEVRGKGLAVVLTLLEQPEQLGLKYFFQVNVHTLLLFNHI